MGLSCKEVGGVQMDEMCVDDKWSGKNTKTMTEQGDAMKIAVRNTV